MWGSGDMGIFELMKMGGLTSEEWGNLRELWGLSTNLWGYDENLMGT